MVFPARFAFFLSLCSFAFLPLTVRAAASGPPLATGKQKWLGSVSSSSQVTDFTHYWNVVTPENGGKWGSVEGTRNVMNWTELDAAYNLAKANGYPFRMHTLIWGNQQPAWIAALSASEQRQEIEQWYAAVAARYPDIDYIDVVNEPLHAPPRATADGGNYLNALGGAGASGWEWVLQSFRLARLYFPRAQLVLNDYSIINSTTSTQQLLMIINLLKSEGLIDLIGEQAHAFTTKNASATTMTTNLNALAATGLPLWMTELDIDGVSDPVQLAEYQRLFPVLWEHPSVVGITLWGYRPGLWRNTEGAYLVQADGSERSALLWLRSYIATTNPDLLASILTHPANQTVAAGATATFSVGAAGNPSPTFQWRKNGVNINGAMSGTYSITVATDGDAGLYSVVVSNAGRSVISNGATLTVTAAPPPPPPPPPVSTYRAPADFNGDGQSDLLWQNVTTGARRAWFMNGTVKGSEVTLSPLGTDWQIAGTADFNADGKPDLLWQNTTTGERAVRLMNGTSEGTFSSIAVVDPTWNIGATADLNGDANPDIIWENTLTGERGIWLMLGTARIGWVSLGTLPIQWNLAGTGDFNADNKPDLVWQNTLTGERKVWLMNATAKASEVSLGFVALEWAIGTVADYTGDGMPDIFWQNSTTGERLIWVMNGTTLNSYAFLPTETLDWVVGRIPRRPASADFNRDGKPDLIWQNNSTGDRKVWLMNATTFSSEVSLGLVGTAWQIAGTGDLNGDGLCDVLWQNTTTGERAVWVMSGTNVSAFVSLATVPTDWQMVGTGDFNADNQTDIVWQNTVTGERGIWLMAGTALSGYASLGVVPPVWQIAAVADLNRDDNPDLVWQNTTTGERKVWLMTGTAFGSEVALGTVGLEWQIVGAADYDLNGSVDIVWQSTLTGERGIWLMNATVLSGYVSLGIQTTAWQIAN